MLRKYILPFGVINSIPSMVVSNFSVSVDLAFSKALRTAMAAANPPQVKKSGGSLNLD